MADRTLSIAAKPWTPATAGAGSVGAGISSPTHVDVASTEADATGGMMPLGMTFPSAVQSVGGAYEQQMMAMMMQQQMAMMSIMAMGGAVPMPVPAMPLSVQVGVSAPFVPTMTSNMPTRQPARVPRGRGNSGRGLRAQQDMKHKAANMPPPYSMVVPNADEEQDDDSYNPLAPVQREDEEATFGKVALGVLDDVSGAVIRSTPKVINNVIGSTNATPSHATAPRITKPTPAYTPSPFNTPSHFTVNASAKPFAPPSYPPSQSLGNITPPANANAAPEDASSDDEGMPMQRLDGAVKTEADALRVDADTFFTEQVDESQVKQAAIALQKTQENPFSITSLQGVRATMPTIEPAPWYPLRYMNEDVFVPAPFKPDDGHPNPNMKQHMSVCHPEQYPTAALHLFYYLCYHCPITCQLSKITDRPPDLKLGGICGDINPACIAHLVESLSGIKLIALDVFGHNFGRCNLWLQDPSDAPRMMAALDRRVWMSPVPHGYAVVVDDDDSREYLLWYLEGLREHGPRRVRFPRHLMTCEKWIV